MADNILGLIFEISADPSKAEAALARFQSTADKTFLSLQNATLAIGAFALTAGGALLGAAEHAAKYAEEIEHVAARSGATAEQVSTLRFAADRAGVSFDTVQRSLTFLAKNLGNLDAPGNKAAKVMAELGIHSTNVKEILPTLLERLAQLESGSKKTADVMALMGRGGGAMIPVLNELRQGFKQVTDEAAALGLVITEKDIVAAHMFLAEQRTLKAELEGLTLHIGQKLLPALITGAAYLLNLGSAADVARQRLVSVNEALLGFTLGLSFQYSTAARHYQLAVDAANAAERAQQKLDAGVSKTIGTFTAMARASLAAGIELKEYGKAIKTDSDFLDEFIRMHREAAKELEAIEKFEAEIAHETFKFVNDYNEFTGKAILKYRLHHRQMQVDVKQTGEAVLAANLKIHQSTLQFIRDMNLQGVSVQQLHREFVRVFGLGLPQQLNISRKALQLWAKDFHIQMTFSEQALIALREEGVRTFTELSGAMGQSIANAIVYSTSIGDAMAKALKATLAAIAGEAMVRAIYNTGLGFYYLAIQDYRSAALAFKAAAIFGTIGVVAAGIGRAIPGGDQGVAGPRPVGVATAGGSATGVVTGGAAGGAGGPTINVFIEGVISSDVLRRVIDQISSQVQDGRARLVSTSSLAPIVART